jgi:hypothetical protein
MIKNSTILFALLLVSVQSLIANEYFVVQVGLFLNPKRADFDNIKALGYIYAEEEGGSTFRILLGDFDNVQDAAAAERQVRQNGFTDAAVVKRNATLGKNVAVIQLATKSFKESINWAPLYEIGNIFIFVENNQLKIVTGTYNNLNEAKLALNDMKSKGFKDAFPKMVNDARLRQPGAFELGDFKQPLIPIEFENSEKPIRSNDNKDLVARGSTQGIESNDKINNKSSMIPRIRNNVKRQSVVNLQAALKSIKSYNGSVDGLYGAGTADAFAQAANGNSQYKKYKLLSQYGTELNSANNTANVPLQTAINTLWENTDNAYNTFTRSPIPLAKAYQAYWLFQKNGPSSGVNSLMNGAIGNAFKNTSTNNLPPLDPKATYAYNDLEQVIRHLIYIHNAQNTYTLPCWILERHAKESNSAFAGNDNMSLTTNCNSFASWETVQVLQAITRDMSDSPNSSVSPELSALFIAPSALNQATMDGLSAWNDLVWENLNAWSSRDPLHEKLVVAMKLAYFQTQIQLEDYYMDRGFSLIQAKGLALAVLKAMVGEDLERFL